ncbi:signal peptidase I [Butyrivibrio sp. ob235]|uniref:signal peptidase I n=1 Tax=Butyrivibrio sp. ob235 TaxID=1761780 RepID=UPI0008BD161C|nr:signal peptidase I [Butyrivibrio sp. ob235]SEK65082.1 signal peptidase I [Butyrivibrio sp. ob235]
MKPYKYILTIIICILMSFIFYSRRKERLISNNHSQSAGIKFDRTLLTDLGLTILPFFILYIVLSKVIIIGGCQSGSMEPTIMTGSITFSNGLAYITHEPQRGDIIYFSNEQTEHKVFVKRIIGLPGDNVSFTDGNVYINGLLLAEDYLSEDVLTYCDKEFKVPADSYFLLGDNREYSFDSRYWDNPYVSKDDIGGKYITSIIIPLVKKNNSQLSETVME